MANIGPSELLVLAVGFLLAVALIGGVVFAAVKLASRSRRG